MKYDFTSLMNRSGHDAIAVDQIPIPGAEVKEGFSRIPMWGAERTRRGLRPHSHVGGRHELPVSSDHSGSNARESQRTAFWLL